MLFFDQDADHTGFEQDSAGSDMDTGIRASGVATSLTHAPGTPGTPE